MKKNEFSIVTDTACDLPCKLLNMLGIFALPMHVIIDGKDYLHYSDFRNLPQNDFYKAIEDDAEITTSQVDLFEAEKLFTSLIKDKKDILYISFSSGLSGSYSGISMLANELREKYPERKINIVDSLCASGGEGLLVYMAAKNKFKGMSMEKLTAWIEDTKGKISHWFTVDNLERLKKGGRIGNATAYVGSLLKIKPIMKMDENGRLTGNSKCSGRRKSLEILTNKIKKNMENSSHKTVFISHAQCSEDAEEIERQIKDENPDAEVVIVDIDPIIAAHTGRGCIAVFYVNE